MIRARVQRASLTDWRLYLRAIPVGLSNKVRRVSSAGNALSKSLLGDYLCKILLHCAAKSSVEHDALSHWHLQRASPSHQVLHSNPFGGPSPRRMKKYVDISLTSSWAAVINFYYHYTCVAPRHPPPCHICFIDCATWSSGSSSARLAPLSMCSTSCSQCPLCVPPHKPNRARNALLPLTFVSSECQRPVIRLPLLITAWDISWRCHMTR